MNVALSIDERLVARARKKADAWARGSISYPGSNFRVVRYSGSIRETPFYAVEISEASRTPLWILSGQEDRGRRLSKGRGSPGKRRGSWRCHSRARTPGQGPGVRVRRLARFPSAHACELVGEEVGRRVLVPHRALEQFVRAHHPIAVCRRLTAIPQETHRYRSGIL